MVSMLTPSAATSWATTPKAVAVIGLPSTTMEWVDGSRITGMPSLRSTVTLRPTPCTAASTSLRNGDPAPVGPGSATSTPRVN